MAEVLHLAAYEQYNPFGTIQYGDTALLLGYGPLYQNDSVMDPSGDLTLYGRQVDQTALELGLLHTETLQDDVGPEVFTRICMQVTPQKGTEVARFAAERLVACAKDGGFAVTQRTRPRCVNGNAGIVYADNRPTILSSHSEPGRPIKAVIALELIGVTPKGSSRNIYYPLKSAIIGATVTPAFQDQPAQGRFALPNLFGLPNIASMRLSHTERRTLGMAHAINWLASQSYKKS